MHDRFPRAAAGVAMFLIASAPAIASDWNVTCDADNYCIARLPVANANDADGRIKIERGAAEGSRVFVTLGATPVFEPGMVVAVEALGTGFRHEGPVAKVYRGNEMTFGEAARGPIVEALRGALKAQFTVAFGGTVGTMVYDADLTGLTAALLEIDQAQRRVGRADAMVAWGAEPAGTGTGAGARAQAAAEPAATEPAAPEAAAVEPPAPEAAAPATASAPAEPAASAVAEASGEDTAPIGSGSNIYERSELPAAIAAISDAYGCALDEALGAWGGGALGMGNGRVMYQVPCHNADINVESHVVLAEPDGRVTAFEFERPPGENAPLRPTLVNPTYDPSTGLLDATVYDSPNGDCGEFERHRFLADQIGFELIEVRTKTECDGKGGIPSEWPLSWSIDELGG